MIKFIYNTPLMIYSEFHTAFALILTSIQTKPPILPSEQDTNALHQSHKFPAHSVHNY